MILGCCAKNLAELSFLRRVLAPTTAPSLWGPLTQGKGKKITVKTKLTNIIISAQLLPYPGGFRALDVL